MKGEKIIMSEQLGIINEIGDLGLGFDPINEEDLEKIKNEEDK